MRMIFYITFIYPDTSRIVLSDTTVDSQYASMRARQLITSGDNVY
jgi:hypothetical protein